MTNRSHLFAALVLCVILFAGRTGWSNERVRSGLQPGEPITTIFTPLNVNGPHAGEAHCLVCENGANPVAMIFARQLSPPLLRLLAKIEAAVTRHGDQQLGSFVVFLNDDQQLPQQLEEAAKKHSLTHVVLAVDQPPGPEGFEVAEEAEVTVVLYRDHMVEANHAFGKNQLTDQAAAKILADLPKILVEK